MPYSKDLFMIKLNGPDNVFLADFIRFGGKLLGPQARDGTCALMRSLISECVDGCRYILHDIGSGRKSLYDLFAFGIFFIQGPSNGREICINCFCYGLEIVNYIVKL